MDALFAKKNKKKGKKVGKVDLNAQLRSGVAMDTEDPTEKLQRMKLEQDVKTSLKKQTTDSDWTECEAIKKKKPVINTSGKAIADLG